MAEIGINGTAVTIHDLEVEDGVLAELVNAQPDDRRAEMVRRVLEVGARGLLTMGLGIDLAEVDARVRRSVDEVTGEARDQVEQVLAAARQAFGEHFDPDVRSSMLARALDGFTQWRDGFLQSFNPDFTDSHTARFLEQLNDLLGPDGVLEARLFGVLDPDADGSALSRLSKSIDERFGEMRDLLMQERGKQIEADRGTRKGFEYEDAVEKALRESLKSSGCVVERTGQTKGDLGAETMVGDFVVTLGSGRRIVFEAKNTARINLTGRDGILEELDRAMANRSADFAVCVSARDAFPREVGPLGVYGERILIVDEGDGTMLAVALRLAEMLLEQSTARRATDLDRGFLHDRMQRLRQLAQLFTNNRRSLTDIKTSVESVHGSLEQIRSELLFLVDEISHEVDRSGVAEPSPATVVHLRSEAS
ncbi:MAG: hypothetical protein RI637_05845 [Acidimicrobiia bacterium]|nr:hypothetical protein [Acidimicrobiia bacterium]